MFYSVFLLSDNGEVMLLPAFIYSKSVAHVRASWIPRYTGREDVVQRTCSITC